MMIENHPVGKKDEAKKGEKEERRVVMVGNRLALCKNKYTRKLSYKPYMLRLHVPKHFESMLHASDDSKEP